jgi:glutamate carboxypeptidase
MEPTEGNELLAEALSKSNLALGYRKVITGNPDSSGAGDISYIAAYVDGLDGLGASGKGAHAPGEVLNVPEYLKLMKRSAVFIYRLTR